MERYTIIPSKPVEGIVYLDKKHAYGIEINDALEEATISSIIRAAGFDPQYHRIKRRNDLDYYPIVNIINESNPIVVAYIDDPGNHLDELNYYGENAMF